LRFLPQITTIVFCFFLICFANAQDISKPIQSPKKAALLSAALPGLGQIYNKKYWKVPIIYVGLLTSAYYINDNHNQYKQYKDAYLIRIDTDPNTVDDFVSQYSSGDLIILKDFYRRNREVSIMFLVGTYILNIIDASVDAHLFYYDVSDDISLQITPTSSQNFNGLCLTLNL